MSLSVASERLHSGELDRIAAVAMLALAVVLFPLRFFVSQGLVHTVPLVLGVASGLYLAVDRYDVDGSALEQWRRGRTASTALRRAFVAGLAGTIFVGAYTGGRSIPFYALAALVGALLFAQVFFLRESALDPGSVLVQIVAFALVVRWVALLTTPGLIGVDSWVHVPEYARSIREAGELSAIDGSKYYGAPLYHLLVVFGAEAFGSSLRTALYLSLGLVVPLSALLLYVTGRYFLPVRWALFATAAFSVADHVVRWSIHLIPTSMGLVFFLGVFYGVARTYATRGTAATYGLVLFFAVATVFTHQISTFILLVFLGSGALIQLYGRIVAPRTPLPEPARPEHAVNFVGLTALVGAITAINWQFLTPETSGQSSTFLQGMVTRLVTRGGNVGLLELDSASTVESAAIEPLLTSVPLSVEILDLSGFLLLLFVTLVGAFVLLQRHHRGLLSLSWLSATGLMSLVTLGMPILGLYFLIPGRWYAFMYVPMVVVGAYALSHFETEMPARGFLVTLVLLACVFPGAMLINHKATHDRPVMDDYYHRFAYTESELGGAAAISSIQPPGETLRTDSPYHIYFTDATDAAAEPIELYGNGSVTRESVVYREYQTDGGAQVEFEGETVRVQLPPDLVCDPGRNVVYSAGDVRYCRGR